MSDSKIIDRRLVELPPHLRKTASTMFNPDIVDKVTLEEITYLSDGLKVKGYLSQPKESGNYPLLIWNRGGSGDVGALDDLRATLILSSTAMWGYVVLATQYRGNKGSEGKEDWGGEDINDALNLIDVAKEITSADITKIAIEGASRGGMTTYRALTKYNDFKCAIVHAGVTDLFLLEEKGGDGLKQFMEFQFGNLMPDEKERAFAKRSVVYFADSLPKQTPILIMHGDQDSQVPLEQSELLIKELEKQAIPHQFELIPGGGHVALKDGSYKIIDQYRKEWLKKHLS